MLGFGELEAAIMGVVWSRTAPVTVREVFDSLRPERASAYTTVLTVMNVLTRKGWLRRDGSGRGRAARYEATTSREEYAASVMRAALEGSEDPAAVLAHFVRQAPPEETAALRAELTQMLREESP